MRPVVAIKIFQMVKIDFKFLQISSWEHLVDIVISGVFCDNTIPRDRKSMGNVVPSSTAVEAAFPKK